MAIGRASGLNDRMPAEASAAQACQRALGATLTSFGYQLVDPPVLEFVELFLAKAGEVPGVRLFTVGEGASRLCLRPEFTASVGRLFVEHLQQWPRPIRLQFAGPVFRLETPQRGRSRQFTVVGAELIGAEGPVADAEIIAMGCEALRTAGVRRFKVLVGHMGLMQEVVQSFSLSQRGQQFVLRHLEHLRKPHLGRAHVERLLDALYPAAPPSSPLGGPGEVAAPALSANGAAAEALTSMLAAHGGFLGSRSPAEVGRRLTEKRRTSSERQRINQALDVVEQLTRLAGPADSALAEAQSFFQSRGWSDACLADLHRTVQLVLAYGVPSDALFLDLGMGRGLHYYTGLVFEIHRAEGAGADSQLCGGGRYDDLLRALGSRDQVPAAGFAVGLERVLSCLEAEPPRREECQEETQDLRGLAKNTPSRVTPSPCADDSAGHADGGADVMVVPVEADDVAYAIGVARSLRAETTLRVELQLKGHLSLGQSLHLAARRSIPLVVIAGARERERSSVLLRRMANRAQEEAPLTGLSAAVQAAHAQ